MIFAYEHLAKQFAGHTLMLDAYPKHYDWLQWHRGVSFWKTTAGSLRNVIGIDCVLFYNRFTTAIYFKMVE